MNALSSVSNHELRERLSDAVSFERVARADVIRHLAELDRRRLPRFPFHATRPAAIPRLRQTGSESLRLGRTVYLDACSSLFSYCMERLAYSEDAALKRVRVVRLVQRFPRVLDELESGGIHLTGLFLLSGHLTEDNAEELLDEARGKSKRQVAELLARRFPRPDVQPSITPFVPEPVQTLLVTCPGPGEGVPPPAPPPPPPRPRVEPLSATSCRVEFTARASLWARIEHARNLVSHAVPSGDLVEVIELAFDWLIAMETKRHSGAGKPRKQRATKPGSRHVPVEVQRAVRERDGDQRTFLDAEGRRCSENRPSGRAGGAPLRVTTVARSQHDRPRRRECESGPGRRRLFRPLGVARRNRRRRSEKKSGALQSSAEREKFPQFPATQ